MSNAANMRLQRTALRIAAEPKRSLHIGRFVLSSTIAILVLATGWEILAI